MPLLKLVFTSALVKRKVPPKEVETGGAVTRVVFSLHGFTGEKLEIEPAFADKPGVRLILE